MFFSFFRHKDEDEDESSELNDRKDQSSLSGSSSLSSQAASDRFSKYRTGSAARAGSPLSGRPGASGTLHGSTLNRRPAAGADSASRSAQLLKERYQAYERQKAELKAREADPKAAAAARQAMAARISSIGRPTVTSSLPSRNIPRNPDVVPSVPKASSRLPQPTREVSDMQYHRFAVYLQEKSGIVLGEHKQYLVNSRLSSLLPTFHLNSVDDLINQAMEEKNEKLTEQVLDAMTTNETLWFRDTYPYLALSNIILPELAMRGKYPVRIWSAACSSGQEPYSIGIVIQEMMSHMVHIDPTQVQIIGTDLSAEMLQRCREGLYDAHALSRGLSSERRAKFFKPTHNPNLMRMDSRVKRMVEFRPLNLLGSYALMGRFDVIFCRNVLIYFNNDVKASILRKFGMCLNKGGYLIVGATETLTGVADQYEMIRCNPGIIYRKK